MSISIVEPRYTDDAAMWADCCSRFGAAEARNICRRYLDMQVRTTKTDELEFCRELYAAMQSSNLGGHEIE